MRKYNKAQTEILGLAIVVVLILVATVFVVRFLVLKEPAEYRTGFLSSELASNMLNTFLKTTSNNCKQLSMTELLQDCAKIYGGSIECDNREYSCKYTNSTANSIFARTFGLWNINYEFLAYTDVNSPLIELGEACRADKKSKLQPIPISTGVMYVKLDICE